METHEGIGTLGTGYCDTRQGRFAERTGTYRMFAMLCKFFFKNPAEPHDLHIDRKLR